MGNKMVRCATTNSSPKFPKRSQFSHSKHLFDKLVIRPFLRTICDVLEFKEIWKKTGMFNPVSYVATEHPQSDHTVKYFIMSMIFKKRSNTIQVVPSHHVSHQEFLTFYKYLSFENRIVIML
jgi:hypothetical protein